jgi:hypothetical protein
MNSKKPSARPSKNTVKYEAVVPFTVTVPLPNFSKRFKQMASKSKNKVEKNDYHSRQIRRNQVIFGVIAVILILSMALSMVKF